MSGTKSRATRTAKRLAEREQEIRRLSDLQRARRIKTALRDLYKQRKDAQ